MGIESFYVNIEMNINLIMRFENLMELNEVYQNAFFYSTINNSITITGSLVSFFPACELLYNICHELDSKENQILIESLNQATEFTFHDSFEFFCWMYKLWQDKIRHFHKNWGAFIINPNQYYKTRNKLSKHCYKKID